jgi:formyl-CoA transferase/CoA:oxalate CoA-transferase
VLPLENVFVTDLTHGQQGPHATVMLADMGAQVVKVEPPGGEISRRVAIPEPIPDELRLDREAYVLAHNRGKRSITLDLKNPRGREVLIRLVERSDVFVQNFRPGVAERLGLDYESLRQVNPSLICACASGYGLKGPKTTRAGLDILGQAESGIMKQTGLPGMPHFPVGVAIADHVGSIFLAYGIMVGLYHRQLTGQGQQVDVSLLGSMIALQPWPITSYLLSGKLPPRSGRGLGYGRSLWMVFPAQDDSFVLAGVKEDQWEAFCRVVGLPDLATDERFATLAGRREHFDELVAVLDKVFQTRPRTHWINSLEAQGITASPVNSYAETVQDPQTIANEYIVPMKHPRLGEIQVTGVPVRLSATPGQIKRPAPLAGEHTEEVLRELGYEREAILELRRCQVI